jgi:hypothetical protein
MKVKVLKSPYHTGPRKGDIGIVQESRYVGSNQEVWHVDFGKEIGIWWMRPGELQIWRLLEKC